MLRSPRRRPGQTAAVCVLAGVLVGACSNNLTLSADVDYRGKTCAGLGREFGRYLDTDVAHIERTGEARYFKAERSGQPPVVRDILGIADSGTPDDKLSLLFLAPVGHMRELGEAIRARELSCSSEELAAASERELSEDVKATLLGSLQPQAADPTAPGADQTWAGWWELYGGAAVSAPPERPQPKLSEDGPDF